MNNEKSFAGIERIDLVLQLARYLVSLRQK